MRTICKYEIIDPFHIELNLSTNAEILSVETLNNKPFIVTLENLNNPLERRMFQAIPTGGTLRDELETSEYLGAFYTCDENMNRIESTGWYLFELKLRRETNNGE